MLLLYMIQIRHALPLRNNKDSSAVFFDSSSSDNIVIIIPKPDVVIENTAAKPHMKFHTVSCFQDIIEEEEDKEDEDNFEEDPLMLFFDEYDFTDKEEEEDKAANNTLYGLLDFFYVVKDTFNSVWKNLPWTTSTNPFIKQNEIDLKLQFHFDV